MSVFLSKLVRLLNRKGAMDAKETQRLLLNFSATLRFRDEAYSGQVPTITG